MINVNVFEINDPRRATHIAKSEKQANAYEELLGGRHALMGNAYDPWNQMCISWSMYNDLKNKNYNDKKIPDVVIEQYEVPCFLKS